jgi:hypothetical protein
MSGNYKHLGTCYSWEEDDEGTECWNLQPYQKWSESFFKTQNKHKNLMRKMFDSVSVSVKISKCD